MKKNSSIPFIIAALAILFLMVNDPSVYVTQGKDHKEGHIHVKWLLDAYAGWSPWNLTSLGSSWVGVDAYSSFANGGMTSYTGSLSSAIDVGDLFVGLAMCSGTPTACDSPIATFSFSDNDSTTFTAWPVGAKINGADSAHGAYEFFIGCANTAKASGYTFTASSSANIEDYGIAHLRWTGTGAGNCPVLETANGTGSSGTSQSIYFSNTGSTSASFSGGVTTVNPNALVLSGQNMGGTQSSPAASWIPADQAAVSSPAACSFSNTPSDPFCMFVAFFQASPGAALWTWNQTAGNGYMDGVMAFDPPPTGTRFVSAAGGTFSGGSQCNGQNTITVATFNSTTLSAGDTNYLCGTFSASAGASNYITINQSGSSGNPISLIFDTSALLTSTYWSGAAINLEGKNYITVDGGSNGTIQATANGTGKANQQDGGIGVELGAGANDIVKNLTIQNLYVRTCTLPVSNCTDENATFVIGIHGNGTGNDLFENNTIHDVWTALLYAFQSGTTNLETKYVTAYNLNWGLIYGDASGGATCDSTCIIHDSEVHDFGQWDDQADNYHHDGAYIFTNNAGSVVNGAQIYNMYVHGEPGVNSNAWIFVSDSGGTVENTKIFNCLLVNGSAGARYPANGMINDWGQNDLIANDTFVGISSTDSSQGDEAISLSGGGVNVTLKNNIFDTFYIDMYQPSGSSISASDYNDFYQFSFIADSATYGFVSSLATWQGHGFDAHSTTGNPNLSGSYLLQSPSAGIGSGVNLSGLSIAPLANGAPQTFGVSGACGTGCIARGTTWDMGLYPFSSGGTSGTSVAGGVKLTGGATIQ